MAGSVLDVSGLSVDFATLRGPLRVLDGVDFSLDEGEILGLVGESGSGKSVSAMTVMGLLPDAARVAAGSIRLAGRDLVGLDRKALLSLRGRAMAMIFQEPMTSLNPVLTVGFQIAETRMLHFGESEPAAMRKAVEMMEAVGIPDAAARALDYPHQLSGGMRQRIMIAIAMAGEPRLLIADEPTTALDVTIQAQILDLMLDLRERTGTAILMITHDMGVIAQMADRVAVMYAGQIVEQAGADDLFDRPAHPYTRRLLQSIPSARNRVDRLKIIPGTTPSPRDFASGCRFQPRCEEALPPCTTDAQVLADFGPGRVVRCWRCFDGQEGARS